MLLDADAIETIRALVGCEVGNLKPIKKLAINSLDRENVLSLFEKEVKRMGFKWDLYAEEIVEIVIRTWKFMEQSRQTISAQTPGQRRLYPAWRLKRSKTKSLEERNQDRKRR